jgi:hypothetical protein
MKKFTFFLIIMTLTCSLSAENEIPRHGLTLHVGGAGAAVEFEYQYRFAVNDKHAFSACIGLNSVGFNVGFPLGVNYTYGQKNQLLLGLRFVPNVLFSSFDEEVEVPFWSFLANFRIGYGRELRIFKQDFTLYAYLSPFMNMESDMILPWLGIGLTQYF